MKITAIETTVLRLPEVRPIGDGCQSILLIRIRTDEGITGIGEVDTNPTVTKAMIDAPLCSVASRGLREILIGERPLEIGRLWDKMTSRPPSTAGGARRSMPSAASTSASGTSSARPWAGRSIACWAGPGPSAFPSMPAI